MRRTFAGLGFDPAPGSAGDVLATLDALLGAGDQLAGSPASLRDTLAGDAGWAGASAEEFAASGADLPDALQRVHGELLTAGRALRTWHARLLINQHSAERLDAAARRLRARIADAERAVRGPNQLDAVQGAHNTLAELRGRLAGTLRAAARLAARHQREADTAAGALRGNPVAGAWPHGAADAPAMDASATSAWTGQLATVVLPTGADPVLALPAGAQRGDDHWPGLPVDLDQSPETDAAQALALDGRPGQAVGPAVAPALLPDSGDTAAAAGVVRQATARTPHLRVRRRHAAELVAAREVTTPAHAVAHKTPHHHEKNPVRHRDPAGKPAHHEHRSVQRATPDPAPRHNGQPAHHDHPEHAKPAGSTDPAALAVADGGQSDGKQSEARLPVAHDAAASASAAQPHESNQSRPTARPAAADDGCNPVVATQHTHAPAGVPADQPRSTLPKGEHHSVHHKADDQPHTTTGAMPLHRDPGAFTAVVLPAPAGWDGSDITPLPDAGLVPRPGGPGDEEVVATMVIAAALGPALIVESGPRAAKPPKRTRAASRMRAFLLQPAGERLVMLTMACRSADGWTTRRALFLRAVGDYRPRAAHPPCR